MIETSRSTRSGDLLVRVDRLVKSYGSTRAVRGASFEIATGEIHALCGHNGAGKSTVVKMLSGQEAPDDGTILLGGHAVDLRSRQAAQRQGIALVDQELSVVPALTVAENLVLGDVRASWLNQGRRLRGRFRSLLDGVGLEHVDLDQPLSSLGIGERQLVEIARALGQDARLVILDEPTATLTDVESEYVYASARRLAAAGRSVLFVSHRLGEVLDLCDRVTVMRDGEVVATTRSDELTIDSLIHQMLGEAPQRADRRSDLDRAGEVALRVRDLSVPGRVVDFGLSVQAGRVYALAGQLGSGASDVLRAIAGLVSTAFSLTAKPETVSQPHLARRPQAWSAPVTKPRPNKPSRRAAITVGLLTFALAHSGSALAARAERALVLEATAPGVWRAEARRMTVEFRRTGAETDPRLTIRFLDANGEVVSPPTARRVTLSAPDQAIVFTLNGREWTSTSMQFAPREGAMLSIVEADHQHDFRLNVHAPASPEARP